MNPLAQLRKGTTALAVLAALERGPIYGYGLRREVYAKTKGVFDFNEGALYPVLHSLTRRRLIHCTPQQVGGRCRKYYELTPQGRRLLAACRAEWDALLKALDAIL